MARKNLKNLAVDQGAGEEAPTSTDALIAEKSNGDPKWFNVSALESALDHDALTNFESDEHAAPKKSIEVDAGELQLVGDEVSPGNNQVYGTDGSGIKGWKNDPAGVGASAIDDLSDVTISGTPADNEVLAYDTTSGEFINQTAAEAGLAAASHNHAAGDVTSGTFDDARIAESSVTQHEAALSVSSSQISDSTAAGRAMLTAADADAQAALLGLQPFNAVQTSATAITIDDDEWGQNLISAATGAVTVTLGNATSEDAYGAITEGDQTITVQVAANVQYYLEGDDLDGTGRTASFEIRGSITWEVFRIDAGNRRYLIKGGTNHDQDLRGNVVHGNLAGTGTATGTLGSSDSGKALRTTGNITIPQTAGFNVTLIAGGAHTVGFGATTSPAMAAGDVMSIVVDDVPDIHAVLTAAADKVSFT